MATNLLRELGGHARRIARRLYAYGVVKRRAKDNALRATQKAAKQRHTATQKTIKQQQAAAKATTIARVKQIKARVSGVQRVTRSVTKGNRATRAKQLRALRADPKTRQQLRVRARFFTRTK